MHEFRFQSTNQPFQFFRLLMLFFANCAQLVFIDALEILCVCVSCLVRMYIYLFIQRYFMNKHTLNLNTHSHARPYQ